MTDEKPPVLKNPRRILFLLGVLVAVFIVLYISVGATGFIRSQEKDAHRPMTGNEATPVEQAARPSG